MPPWSMHHLQNFHRIRQTLIQVDRFAVLLDVGLIFLLFLPLMARHAVTARFGGRSRQNGRPAPFRFTGNTFGHDGSTSIIYALSDKDPK